VSCFPIFCAVLSLPAHAQSSVFQQGANGYTGVSDTYLDKFSPTANRGSSYLVVRQYGEYKSLLRFDLASIQVGAAVSSAILDLYLYNLGSPANPLTGTAEIHKVMPGRNWNPSQATWNNFLTGNAWSTAGMGAVTDYDTQVAGAIQFLSTDAIGWKSADITGLVQQWVSGAANNGIVLFIPTGNPHSKYFYSSEHSTVALRPRLTVVYSGGSPPPSSAPSISAFSAAPASIIAGQPSTLSWTQTGATSLTIDNGVGDVTGLMSKAVAPPQTTTYRLTATNSHGSTTAETTVTVAAPPPSTGAIIADHNAANAFASIPPEWLEAAKQLTIYYVGASHAQQIMQGSDAWEQANPAYSMAWQQFHSWPPFQLPGAERPPELRMSFLAGTLTGYWPVPRTFQTWRRLPATLLILHVQLVRRDDGYDAGRMRNAISIPNALRTNFRACASSILGHLRLLPNLTTNNQMVRDTPGLR
jgi:hypothetical protein